ncbi:hypothetical protein [Edaphobacter acidisoli]|uniref:hypothetical protein n=1 Tax=Edaphobacter acidisoli TaxID=2040573 RepID=UPI00166E7F79|nr:hypothetical protein [Edaphobacter acidisoli]
MSATVIQNSLQGRRVFSVPTISTAKKFIRKMRGGSQAILIQCDDEEYVVVKMLGSPQGANILANEIIGGVIANEAGLPVVPGGCVYLSDDFIDKNPSLWFETPLGRRRPNAGLHFGSAFLGEMAGPNRPTDFISRSRVSAIRNRSDFLGMYVMDIWANHQDHRQAIFRTSDDGRGLDACFIDHGHMFGGPNWNFTEYSGVTYHLEPSLYSGLFQPAAVADWISHYEDVLPKALAYAVSLVPSKWYKGNIDLLEQELLCRLARLQQLIEADTTAAWRFTQRSTANDQLLPHFGIHHLGATE